MAARAATARLAVARDHQPLAGMNARRRADVVGLHDGGRRHAVAPRDGIDGLARRDRDRGAAIPAPVGVRRGLRTPPIRWRRAPVGRALWARHGSALQRRAAATPDARRRRRTCAVCGGKRPAFHPADGRGLCGDRAGRFGMLADANGLSLNRDASPLQAADADGRQRQRSTLAARTARATSRERRTSPPTRTQHTSVELTPCG